MKFFIYNPGPSDECLNPTCNRFHLKTSNPSHSFDCYRVAERPPPRFQCSERVLELSEPHPRHRTRKYEKIFWPYAKTPIVRLPKVSSRLEHLAQPIFRRVFTTRQHLEHRPSVKNHVKANLNVNVQKSMYNIYSRLENVRFPNIPDSRRKPVKASCENFEDRMRTIERLSQPRKIPNAEVEKNDVVKRERRPINMAVFKRLSIPRKIKSPDEYLTNAFPSRPLRSLEYYEQLSKPRKVVEDNKDPEPKLKSMQRTLELAVQWSRLQRRKFMKGDNDKFRFAVKQSALQYQPSAKIIKLAKPRQVPEDSNQSVAKRKKKK